jgi:hypothetical protein
VYESDRGPFSSISGNPVLYIRLPISFVVYGLVAYIDFQFQFCISPARTDFPFKHIISAAAKKSSRGTAHATCSSSSALAALAFAVLYPCIRSLAYFARTFYSTLSLCLRCRVARCEQGFYYACASSVIRSFQKRNFTQSTKCCSLNLALTAPTAQATIFRQNPADWQHWPVDNSNN